MNTDTSTIEPALRAAFQRSAASAPLRTPELPILPVVSVRPARSGATGPLKRRFVVGAIAAAAIVAVVVLAIRTASDDATPAFQPDGSEVPLAEVSPPDPGTPVKPGSLVGLSVPGHPTIARYTTLGWQDGRVMQVDCTWSDGGSGCMPAWNSAAPDLGATSTVDNRAGDFNLYTWSNVPASAAFVTWRSPTGPMWQRPVAGFVGFPYTGTFGDSPLVAFDVDGNVVDIVDAEVSLERMRTGTPPGGWQTDPANPDFLAYAETDNLTSTERGELWGLTESTLGACLGSAADAAWEACVSETTSVVDARFAAMGGKLVPLVVPHDTGDAPTADVTVDPPAPGLSSSTSATTTP